MKTCPRCGAQFAADDFRCPSCAAPRLVVGSELPSGTVHHSLRFPICSLLAVLPPLYCIGYALLTPHGGAGRPGNMAPDPVGILIVFGVAIISILGGFALAFVSLARKEHPRWLAYLALFLYAAVGIFLLYFFNSRQ